MISVFALMIDVKMGCHFNNSMFLIKNIIKLAKYGMKNIAVERNSSTNRYFATSQFSFQSCQICHPKTLNDILPHLMPPPLEPNFLFLRCHFSGYGDDTPDSNSHWSCS